MYTIIPKIVTYLVEPVTKEKVFPEKGIHITRATVIEFLQREYKQKIVN